MTRYIDAEACIKEVRLVGGRDNGFWETSDVVNLICRQHTADVAPRAEVAREIFEGVKALLKKNKCRTYYINGVEVSEHFHTNLEKDLAELKKKYTEGKDDV